jgi:hypothetical protein
MIIDRYLDVLNDLVDGNADHAGLGEHRVDHLGDEALAALRAQLLAGVGADEHADAALLVEDALVDQLGEVLGPASPFPVLPRSHRLGRIGV